MKEFTTRVWDIKEIENLTEDETQEMAIEKMNIKEHNIYFVDFAGYFGYSCLVFKNNHHIYFANDYELHHHGETKEQLREIYIKKLNSILFTESEFSEPLKTYGEYIRKRDYLINYYGLQADYISAFRIFHTDNEEKEFKEKTKLMIFNPVNCSYMNDKDFVKRHIGLYNELSKAQIKSLECYDYLKSAFLYEMSNHEYGINHQGDYDVLSCFGTVNWHSYDIEAYFEDLKFTEMQRRAYMDARKQYFKEMEIRAL